MGPISFYIQTTNKKELHPKLRLEICCIHPSSWAFYHGNYCVFPWLLRTCSHSVFVCIFHTGIWLKTVCIMHLIVFNGNTGRSSVSFFNTDFKSMSRWKSVKSLLDVFSAYHPVQLPVHLAFSIEVQGLWKEAIKQQLLLHFTVWQLGWPDPCTPERGRSLKVGNIHIDMPHMLKMGNPF